MSRLKSVFEKQSKSRPNSLHFIIFTLYLFPCLSIIVHLTNTFLSFSLGCLRTRKTTRVKETSKFLSFFLSLEKRHLATYGKRKKKLFHMILSLGPSERAYIFSNDLRHVKEESERHTLCTEKFSLFCRSREKTWHISVRIFSFL